MFRINSLTGDHFKNDNLFWADKNAPQNYRPCLSLFLFALTTCLLGVPVCGSFCFPSRKELFELREMVICPLLTAYS